MFHPPHFLQGDVHSLSCKMERGRQHNKLFVVTLYERLYQKNLG